MRLVRPVSTLPAPSSISSVHALLFHREDAFAPAHQAGHLLDQQALDLVGIAHRRGADIGDERHPRLAELHFAKRLGHLVGGRLHQRAMEGRADRQHDRAPHAALRGDRDRALDRCLVAAQDELAAAIVVGEIADLALRRGLRRSRARHRARRRASPPSRPCRPAPRAASPGRGASTAAPHRRAPAHARRRAPNIRRANGPATKATWLFRSSLPSFSSTRATARLAAISAGCAFSVSVRSLSGPSNISRERF